MSIPSDVPESPLPEPVPSDHLSRLYRERFADQDLDFKERVWQVLCRRVFQPYVDKSHTVLDLGAGHGEFINSIRCARKIAVDLNPDVARYVHDAQFLQASGTDLGEIEAGSVDVVFSSNFLEHLPDKASVLQTLRECRRILRGNGRLIVLMPNIRYLHGRYWDFFDHHVPLTHFSLEEALTLTGFSVERMVPRFLPYTVKQRSLPRSIALLRLYLRLPVLWPIFGRQMLFVAHPS